MKVCKGDRFNRESRRTNSSQFTFEENIINFKTGLPNRYYPARFVEKHLSEIKFSDRKMSLAQKNKS